MTKLQLQLAAVSVGTLSSVSGTPVDDILEVLRGNVLSDEDCFNVKETLAEKPGGCGDIS